MEELPPPPPPVEPPVESAWERGLRHAKEVNGATVLHANHPDFMPELYVNWDMGNVYSVVQHQMEVHANSSISPSRI